MRRLLPLLLLAGLLVSVASGATPAAAATTDYQPTFPMNITNFYAVGADSPYRVHPAKANYRDVDAIAKQVNEMQYAGQAAAMYSWMGRGSFPDTVFNNALRAADGTSFRWALFYELEGAAGPNHGNPTAAQIKVDLDHIYGRYAHDRNYLRIGGKPVLFVYHDAADRCGVESRWAQADSAHRFYLVQHWVPGYTGCRPQPNSWYVYAPAAGRTQIASSVVAVSPGYYAMRDAAPKLARSVARFTTDLRAMKAAKVQWRETTTWNEWSEGTGVENAAEWKSRSGHGAYVDAMHAVLGSARNTPVAPTGLATSTSGQAVTVHWNASAGATSYDVYRSGCRVATVTGPSWTDTSLTDTSASYTVRGTSAVGTGKPGATVVGIAGTPTPAAPSASDGLVAVPAQRLLRTATGEGLGCAGLNRGQFDVTLPASVPADATGVVLGITGTGATGAGNVQAFPTGGTLPPVYLLRYLTGAVTSSSAIVPIGRGHQIEVRANGAATHLDLTLLGYTHPGTGGLTAYTSKRVTDTRSAVTDLTVPIPSYVPANATAVQLKIRVHGAATAGSLVAFEGGTARPNATSMAYGPSGLVAASVLVPLGSARTVSFHTSSATFIQVGIDGWVTPTSGSLDVVTATRVLATPGQVGDTAVTMPAASAGHVVLLHVTVLNGVTSSLASVYPDGAAGPELATIAFSTGQPKSSLVWVRVPANRIVRVQLRAHAQLCVDQLAVA